jgi:hypothetical protein
MGYIGNSYVVIKIFDKKAEISILAYKRSIEFRMHLLCINKLIIRH